VGLDKYIGLDPVPDDPGVLVEVAPAQGPAGAAGLQAGDLITAVNNERVGTVATFQEVVERLLAKKPPEPLNLLVLRSGKEVPIMIRPE
jgi:S1-C subfamily serine protease